MSCWPASLASSACLSTMIDAYHRGHRVTFLTDASASHPLDAVSAADVHNLLAKVVSLYGSVATTAEWIDATNQEPTLSEIGRDSSHHEFG